MLKVKNNFKSKVENKERELRDLLSLVKLLSNVDIKLYPSF